MLLGLSLVKGSGFRVQGSLILNSNPTFGGFGIQFCKVLNAGCKKCYGFCGMLKGLIWGEGLQLRGAVCMGP